MDSFPTSFRRYLYSFRQYFGVLRQENVFGQLHSLLESIKAHDFQVLSIEPQFKDGGVFVKFSYSAGDPEPALDTIMTELRGAVDKEGGVPSWTGINTGNVWLVKGKPWREVCSFLLDCYCAIIETQDLNRYASPIVKIAFDGPDIKEENLYQLLRVSCSDRFMSSD